MEKIFFCIDLILSCHNFQKSFPISLSFFLSSFFLSFFASYSQPVRQLNFTSYAFKASSLPSFFLFQTPVTFLLLSSTKPLKPPHSFSPPLRCSCLLFFLIPLSFFLSLSFSVSVSSLSLSLSFVLASPDLLSHRGGRSSCVDSPHFLRLDRGLCKRVHCQQPMARRLCLFPGKEV